jgi:predicted dehydrogenase
MSAKIFHIPFIATTPTLELAAIVQRSPTPTNSAPADHPGLQHHTSPEALFASPGIDVVILCTPPPTHHALALAALQAGKHVLLEKPAVPSAAQAHALFALARSRGRLLCVYQNRRYDGDFLTLRRLVAGGALGRVVELNTHFDRHRPDPPTNWKAGLRMDQGGGAVYDLGVHLLDQVFVLFGMPSGVQAKFVAARRGKVVRSDDDDDDDDGDDGPDGLDALLSYDGTGTLVHVRVGVMSVAARQPRFWVRGTKGSYEKRGMDPQEDQLKAGMQVTDAGFGRETEGAGVLDVLRQDGKGVEQKRWPNLDPPETYSAFYRAFAKALETGKEEDLPVRGEDVVAVLKIVEAIRESARTGHEVRF